MVFSFSQISSLVIQDSLADLEAKISGDSVCRGGSNIAYDIGMTQMESLELNYSFLVVHVWFAWSSRDGGLVKMAVGYLAGQAS